MSKFITFEGCDGVGKSTQIAFVKEFLESKGKKVMLTREPGGTPLAEKLREIIIKENMDVITEAHLFAAARSEHLINKIIPALNDGYYVLCDRFIDSSLAYQGYARGLGFERVLEINRFTVENKMPDATIFIDMEPSNTWRKQSSMVIEDDKYEAETLEFHKKVYEGFKTLAKTEDRFISIVPEFEKKQTTEKIIKGLIDKGII